MASDKRFVGGYFFYTHANKLMIPRKWTEYKSSVFCYSGYMIIILYIYNY